MKKTVTTSKDTPAEKPKKAASKKSPDTFSSTLLGIIGELDEAVSYKLDEHEITKSLLQIVSRLTSADSCLLYLYDTDAGVLSLYASLPEHKSLMGKINLKPGEGITGSAAKSKKPVVLESGAKDDPRFKAFSKLPADFYEALASIPIIHKNKVIGVINIHHKKSFKYDDNLLKILSVIANQAGNALENARLYRDLYIYKQKLDTLAQVSGTIVSNQYLEEILQLIVTMTAQMMGSKICSVMLLDKTSKELQVIATQSLSDLYRSKPNIKIDKSIAGKAIQNKKPVAIANVQKSAEYGFPEIAKAEGLVSMLVVPMMIRSKVIGVINIYTTDEYDFTDDDIRVTQAIANQAAVAIENTKLLDKTVEMEQALEARKVVEKAKGLLMKMNNLNEEEAYRLIQKQAMNLRKSLKEIAESVIIAYDIRK